MAKLVFKPHCSAAAAEVFCAFGALAQSDRGIQPGNKGQAAALAEFRPFTRLEAAVVAGG
jgi:hypothetical protein